MYQSVNFYDFERAFVQMDRGNNFSYQGLKALFDYLEELEESIGEHIELDVIAICCDYSEEPLQDVLDNYSLESFEDLQDHTWAVLLSDDETVVYQAY